jgi:hypothetical protein
MFQVLSAITNLRALLPMLLFVTFDYKAEIRKFSVSRPKVDFAIGAVGVHCRHRRHKQRLLKAENVRISATGFRAFPQNCFYKVAADFDWVKWILEAQGGFISGASGFAQEHGNLFLESVFCPPKTAH